MSTTMMFISLCFQVGALIPKQCQEFKALGSDSRARDYFGTAVALTDDLLAVGAFGHEHSRTDSGSVYLFRRSGDVWAQEAELLASDAGEGDWFGGAVAASRDIVVIGAEHDDDACGDMNCDSGAAYVFRNRVGNWIQETKLRAPDGARADSFGFSVSVFGDVIAVGAPTADSYINDSGAVYVYRYSEEAWSFEQKLVPDGLGGRAHFGFSIAGNENLLAIGAPAQSDSGERGGVAYVYRFTKNAWIQEADLHAADPSHGAEFGWSIDTDGQSVIVGAPHKDIPARETGAVYVFEGREGDWHQATKLLASDAAQDANFGSSVAVAGKVVLAGAYLSDSYGASAGAAYTFENHVHNGIQKWIEIDRFASEDIDAFDNFGFTLDLHGAFTAIGARENDDRGDRSGSAYVFQVPSEEEMPCTGNEKIRRLICRRQRLLIRLVGGNQLESVTIEGASGETLTKRLDCEGRSSVNSRRRRHDSGIVTVKWMCGQSHTARYDCD